MCWVALDRGLRMADQLRLTARETADWTAARDEIKDTILTRGWSERAGAYAQSFGSDDLDALVLLMALTGFLPPSDPRLRATIDAIEHALQDERGLLYRYRSSDGFDQPEGTFLLCTFWLAHAFALTGQVGRARETLFGPAGTPASSACSPSRSSPPPASCWETSLRPSVTSG